MRNIGAAYTSLMVGLAAAFSGFGACGAQLYKVSLEDDYGQAEQGGQAAYVAPTDPSANGYGLHAPSGFTTIPISFQVDARLSTEHLRGITLAMNTWSLATGKILFQSNGIHEGVTGDGFPDLYSSLADMVNGQYLDEKWAKTGKASVVLATTIWDNDKRDARKITTSDIRYNGENYVFGDSLIMKQSGSREVVDVQTLATHELGHLLGLSHVSPAVDSESIMISSIYVGEGLTNRRISRGDIERIHKIYGCQGVACDVDQVLAAIEKSILGVPSKKETHQ